MVNVTRLIVALHVYCLSRLLKGEIYEKYTARKMCDYFFSVSIMETLLEPINT
jgi:hypothetical protein